MREMKLFVCVMICALAAWAEAAWTADLGKVVITAGRQEQRIEDVTASVTVVDGREIENAPQGLLEQIITTKAGVDSTYHYRINRMARKAPLDLRGVGGSNAGRVLMLIDGVPQNDAANSSLGWTSWTTVPREAVERVEIVRGPVSALYGSDGLGGAINIITRKPDETRERHLTLSAGSGDTYGGRLYQSKRTGRWGAIAAAAYEDSDGFYTVSPLQSYSIEKYRTLGKLFTKLTFEPGDGTEISMNLMHYQDTMNKGRVIFLGKRQDTNFSLRWEKERGRGSDSATVYASDGELTAYLDKKKPYPHSTENFSGLVYGSIIQCNRRLAAGADLVYGADYTKIYYDRTDRHFIDTVAGEPRRSGAGGIQRRLSPFVNAGLKLTGGRLVVNAGARFDMLKSWSGRAYDSKPTLGYPGFDNHFGSKSYEVFNPKLGVAWHAGERTTLRFSAGRGFRAPSMFELYNTHVRNKIILANPYLEPEEIVSYDIGVERRTRRGGRVRLTYYLSHGTDFIGERSDPSTSGVYERDNINEVDISGVEFEFETPLNRRLSFIGNYTFNRSEIAEDLEDPANEGNLIPYYPEHKARAGFRYAAGRIDARAVYSYNSERFSNISNSTELDSYSTFDIGVSANVRGNMKVSLNAENLFDEEYVVLDESPEDTVSPGRIITGELRCYF